MDSYPELNSDWGEMLTSDLKGMKGIILYKGICRKRTDKLCTDAC